MEGGGIETKSTPSRNPFSLSDPLGRNRKRASLLKGVTQDETGVDDGNKVASRADRQGSPNKGGQGEKEQGRGSEEEEEEDHQEESSMGEGEKGEPCSVCRSRGQVSPCGDCNTPLHESCATSTDPFLCDFCMRKRRLREQECETDATSEREESSDEEREEGDILDTYSVSSLSSESRAEEEYTPKKKLVAEPFSIGGQPSPTARSRRVLRGKTEVVGDTIKGQINLTSHLPTNKRTLFSEVKKETAK